MNWIDLSKDQKAKMRYQNSLLALLTVPILVAGCGGGGGHSASKAATLRFNLDWPDRTRSTPVAANSAVIVVSQGGQEIGRKVLNRDMAIDTASVETANFNDLPAGEAIVTVTAYPEADGAGNAVAAGLLTTDLKRGEVVRETATLSTTATTIELTPTTTVTHPGETGGLGVTVRDVQGELVLVKSGNSRDPIVWETDGPHVTLARAEHGATFTGVSVGTVNVKATFEGLSSTVTIQVQ